MLHRSSYRLLPTGAGVYIFKDKTGKIIYIGKAKDLKKRVSSYFTKKCTSKTEILMSLVEFVGYILVSSEIEALILEANLIKKHHPLYNIKLADDKFFPYIKIAEVPNKKLGINIPYVVITRKKDDHNAQYFGPYPDITAVKTVYKLLRRIFPFQSIKNHPDKKCLYSHIKLCPCIASRPEKLDEYKNNIKKIKNFLEGKKNTIVNSLTKERDYYTKIEEFEKAGETQDKINQINLITSPYYDPLRYEKNPNLYSRRIKEELTSLKDFLSAYYQNINTLERIECYDISNIQGKNATGSMVVFTNGEENKNNYRRFKIKSKTTPDDYKMMQEVITRRLKHGDWKYPDLILIDGGRGQVGSVISVINNQKLNIPVIGLAKREETIVIPVLSNGNIAFHQEKLSLSYPGLNLLRRIRDEAHRFAIQYHRLLREKELNLT